MSVMVLQGPKYSLQKSRPLESGYRRHGVCIAIECSYKLDQKNEFNFCVNYAHFCKSGHIRMYNILLQENTEPLTHTTFTVNANTAYTTIKSVDLSAMVIVSLPVLTRKSPNQQISYHNHHHPLLLPLTISQQPVVTLTQLLVVMIVVV